MHNKIIHVKNWPSEEKVERSNRINNHKPMDLTRLKDDFTQAASGCKMRKPTLQSLYSLCIQQVKQSRHWEHCILSMPIKTIAFDLCTSEMRRNPIIIIATHYSHSDGEIVTGSNCGYNVLQRMFVIGSFSACVCFDPRDYTEWIYSFPVKQVVAGRFENELDDIMLAGESLLDVKEVKLCLQSIHAWAKKYRRQLHCLLKTL